MSDKGLALMRAQHKLDNPDCPYGDSPHFIPPSLGQIGFYACMVPEDITNHSRERNIGMGDTDE